MKRIRFFADVNIEKLIIDRLLALGYDVKSYIDYDKHAEDSQIISLAEKEKRILLTNDKDFGELIYRQKLISYGVILFRLKSQDEVKKFELLNNNVLSLEVDKIEKKFIVISEKKVRFLPY